MLHWKNHSFELIECRAVFEAKGLIFKFDVFGYGLKNHKSRFYKLRIYISQNTVYEVRCENSEHGKELAKKWLKDFYTELGDVINHD